MLLIALFCQVVPEPAVSPPALTHGAIVIKDRESDHLGFDRRRLVPAHPDNEILSNAKDSLLETLWMLPVARVDGNPVTVDDVLFKQQIRQRPPRIDAGQIMTVNGVRFMQQLVFQRGITHSPEEGRSPRLQRMIEEQLPGAIERAAIWNRVLQEFPADMFEESWKRHERSWDETRRLSQKNRKTTREPLMSASLKPHYIKHYVTQDYLNWKFIDERPADATQLTNSKATNAKRIAAFRREITKQAKVETAFVISER